ncbi:uncharacterized protein EKO05_0005220 [Ascochyta rabiei]|uniref:Protection of telomeres protein 1 n=1 Tax=Didymella rabiei TaxID=5454 RepID=A0A163A553_DIDRA|nr:uncharacterized protein EKO05_0005220 [Ascochyta rabiei]KZM20988.1 single-stranded telomeric DNA binding protein [Ascochyta rabiei]UPX14748.1 hypothetical protein EKO05_0005220 [Ascochyta rabiei]
MSGLPQGFTAVKDANAAGAVVSLLGVVVSLRDPRKTRGTDWSLNFFIQDDFTVGSVGGCSSMGCRVFKPSEASLPNITGAGDVVILRNFKLNPWRERMDCVSTPSSGVLVFPASKIPVPELSHAYLLGTRRLVHHATPGAREPTMPEQTAVLKLKHSSSGAAQHVQQHASMTSFNAPARRKEALIKDLELGRFSDIKAQVVNIYYSNNGTVELKVTDYTANKNLYLYADPDKDPDLVAKHDWRGPYGQVTMDVRLYEPHAAWARGNLSNGDFVFLRNVHIKASPANMLEGAMHEDRQMPHQVDVRKLMHQPAIDEINERKAVYEQQRSNQGTVHLANAPKKPSAKTAAKKRFEKKERLRLQKEEELKELEEKEKSWDAERNGINLLVRAGFPEMKLSTLSEIHNNPHLQAQTTKYNNFTLPFINCRHRSRVRVVDFYPPEIEYFVHSSNDPSWTPRSRKNSLWEWGFVLLLEDAHVPHNTVPEQLRVIVNNDAAQHLGLPNARDLKEEPRALVQVKEKLFRLWGNLAELKEELRARSADLPLPPGDNRLQNLPFDCCIEEYGHEVLVSEENPTGYQRLHKLALTKIMD